MSLEVHLFSVHLEIGKHRLERLELPWKRHFLQYDLLHGRLMRDVGNPASGYLDYAGVVSVKELLELGPVDQRESLASTLKGALFCIIHVFES